MHHLIGAIVVGAVASRVTGSGAGVRQGLRGVIKGGIIATRKAQALGASLAAQTSGLVDEARAELDRQPARRPTRPQRR
jgi:hypothetical protein